MSQLPFRVIPQAVPDAPDRIDWIGAGLLAMFGLVAFALGLGLALWLLD